MVMEHMFVKCGQPFETLSVADEDGVGYDHRLVKISKKVSITSR